MNTLVLAGLGQRSLRAPLGIWAASPMRSHGIPDDGPQIFRRPLG